LADATRPVSVVAILLSAIARIRRRRHGLGEEGEAAGLRSIHDWANGERGTSVGFVRANLATIEILLPIVAVVAGLTALAIVKDTVES
jgi:hypothetical protein